MNKRLVALGGALLLTGAIAAGCSVGATQDKPEDETAVMPYASSEEMEVTLYFPEEEGGWLETEKRIVSRNGEALESVILKEMLAGPQDDNLKSYLPDNLGAVVADTSEGTTFVDLSDEIEDIDLWFARLSLQGIVNSLVEVETTDKVQFLLEGKQSHSIAGIYTGEPWEKDMTRVAREDYRPIADTDPRRGEAFIEGEIIGIDMQNMTLTISQHMDSGSQEVGSEIKLTENVVIHLQDEDFEHIEIPLEDVEEGMIAGIVLNPEGKARGVIVHYPYNY